VKVSGWSQCETSDNAVAGWWYTYPSEKYESQLGLIIIPNIWKNQKCSDQVVIVAGVLPSSMVCCKN